MIIRNKSNSELKPNPFNADVRILFANKKIESLHLELKPGKMLSPVEIPNDALFYIIEGCPEVLINDEKEIVSAEALVFCPGGSKHCINNPGDSTARILVIKLL